MLDEETSRHREEVELGYGHELLVAEVFVDPQLFRGTAYQASGWQRLGQTKGYSRVRREYYTEHETPKVLYVRELRRDARRLLCAESMPPQWQAGELKKKVRCRTNAAELKTVREHFEAAGDFRTGHNWTYTLSGLLTLVFCAVQHCRWDGIGLHPNPTREKRHSTDSSVPWLDTSRNWHSAWHSASMPPGFPEARRSFP